MAKKSNAEIAKQNAQIDWDDLIGEKEVLEKLRIDKVTLYRMRTAGKLRFASFNNRHIMYSKKEIIQLING